jgi:hypothetical protein
MGLWRINLSFSIEYNFKDGGNLYQNSFPAKGDDKNSIFLVKGKNDQGKTTVLNMVALGLYGLDSSDIDDKLKSKMRYLKSKDLDECTFDYKIESDTQNLKLESILENNDIHTYYNGQEVGKDFVEERIKILYDTPADDPAKKLDSAIHEIKNNLNDYITYLDRYHSNIQQKIDRIEDYSDKERRIERLKGDLQLKRNAFNNYSDRLLQIEDRINELRKNFIVFRFLEYKNKRDEMTRRKEDIEKMLKDFRKKGGDGGTSKYKLSVAQFRALLSDLKSDLPDFQRSEEFLEEPNKTRLNKLIKSIQKIELPNSVTEKKLKEYLEDITNIIRELEENPLNKIEKVEEKQIELYKKLIEILKQFIDINIEIPGTDGKKINQFIYYIEESQKTLRPKVYEKQSYISVKKTVHTVFSKLEDLIDTKKKIPDTDDLPDIDIEGLKKEKDQVVRKISDLTRVFAPFYQEFENISNDEIEKIVRSGSMVNEYNSATEEKTVLENKIKEHELKITGLIQTITEIDQLTEPPKYNKDDLIKKLDLADRIKLKITKWKKYLESIDFEAKSFNNPENNDAKEFFAAISDYFAGILKVVYYEKKAWTVKKVDLFSRCYIVENRKPIKFIQIGTGHSNLNSLLTRLRQDFSGRKKVVLIDEIGHMDKENLSILLEEIKSQVKDGKIIFALLTIADNSLSAVKWEPINN